MTGSPELVPNEEALCWLNRPDRVNLPFPVINGSSPGSPEIVALAIPSDFSALKAADPTRAAEWRVTTRAAFESLFAAGYTVTRFVRQPDCGVYLLSAKPAQI
jgi:predicted GNAT superfamily acetyltransferase